MYSMTADGIPVSIIITNFNYARFLRRAIDSALSQTHSDVEVIVVDDASTDDTVPVIKSYGDRINSCLKEINGGHGAAFNTGFAASRGQIVLFLDADDYLYPNAVSEIVKAHDTSTSQVQFRLHIVDEGQNIKDVFPPPEVPFDSGDVTRQLLQKGRYQTTVTSGLAFDRPTLNRIMPVPEAEFRQGADGYLATVAPLYGRVKSIEECLGAYRMHGENHSVFAERLGQRARWRVQHDFLRLRALTGEAAQVGIKVPDNLTLRDPVHLEERLASLCVDRGRHPVPDDSRLALAVAGAEASFKMNMSLRRRMVLSAWFLAVGVLPQRMATAVLSWKLQASSRPAFLARMSKSIRRVAG